jgi:hypothetical protein
MIIVTNIITRNEMIKQHMNLFPAMIKAVVDIESGIMALDASKHAIVSYHRLGTLDEMKICLASGFPFVFGFAVYESFESSSDGQTSWIPAA